MKILYFYLITIFFCFVLNKIVYSFELISKDKFFEENKIKIKVMFLRKNNGGLQWFWKSKSKNETKYKGEINQNLPHGIGEINFNTNKENSIKKYFGEWKNGKFHGRGIIMWFNGQVYKGEFKFGKKDGQGTLNFSNGRSYVGQFKYGKYHGKGKFNFGKKDENLETYDGYWLNGKLNGIGSYFYQNGDRYIGEFKENKKHGHGKYNWVNGKEYVGEFYNDIISGFGILTKANGSKFIGEFNDGITWEGILYNFNEHQSIEILNGEKIK